MAEPVLGIAATLRDAFKTVSGMVGLGMIFVLAGAIIVIPIYAPFDVVHTWGDVTAWKDNPRAAAPEWTDLLTTEKLSRTLIVEPGDFLKVNTVSETFGLAAISLRRTFSFEYDTFPSEMTLRLFATYADRSPLVTVDLTRPDGEVVELMTAAPQNQAPTANLYPFSITSATPETLKNIRTWAISNHNATDVAFPKPEVTLFAVAGEDMLDSGRARVLRGDYNIKITALAFTPGDDLDAQFLVYGKVFGVAGTDTFRRDLMTGILWGAPVALAFGTVAALVIVLSQTLLGAISAWYGKRTDEIIQRAADFFLILPVLPILILISIFYRPGIWTILLVIISFSLVGGTTKVIRSLVLQVKEEQFIESALSYGASRMRILFRHIFPRVLPYTFALIALSVPAFIFLEASLSFLGLGDPLLPTWGSLIGAAFRANALFNGIWWWIALPAAGIIFATVAFALLGYSFDRALNPRLREQ